jgi:hypothetical protein
MSSVWASGDQMDPGPESNHGGADEDDLEDWTAGDGAVDDEIGDQLFGLDNLHPDPVQFNVRKIISCTCTVSKKTDSQQVKFCL